MKRKLFFTAFAAIMTCIIIKAQIVNDESKKVIDSGNKRIVITDIKDKQRVDVEVFELQDGNELGPYEKIFEGHYREGKSSEQRKYLMSIDIPAPIKKRKFKNQYKYSHPHHDYSFGIGFAGFADKGDIDDMPFRTGSSPEISLMVYQNALPPISNHLGLVTGLGIRWVRYHLKGNHYFEESNDYTHLVTAPEDWKFKKSKLGITTLNIPLLLEWRNRTMFVSAGPVCSFKTASSSRIFYTDERGGKQKEKVDSGMTLRPVTMDILVQVGIRDFGVYSRYSPVSIFEKNKGPELYPLTFGFMLYFE